MLEIMKHFITVIKEKLIHHMKVMDKQYMEKL